MAAVSGDLPGVAAAISNHRAAIAVGKVAWLLDDGGPAGDCSLVAEIGVRYVHIQERRNWIQKSGFPSRPKPEPEMS